MKPTQTQIENELFRVQCRILDLGTDKSLSAKELRKKLMALRTEIIEAKGPNERTRMTAPTQAQIEALLWPPADMIDLLNSLARAADKHEVSYSETAHLARHAAKTIAALTAAAEVGEDGFCEECGATLPSHKRNCKTGSPVDAAIAAAIERCAQVAESTTYMSGAHIAAAIRALKDRP